MTKARAPLSFAQAVTRIAGLLSFPECARIVGRSDRLVYDWSDPDTGTLPSIEQAFLLDAAWRRAGGEGAPLFETYALLLEIDAAEARGCRFALLDDIAMVAREAGEAIATAARATLPEASASDYRTAISEGEQGIQALTRLVGNLSKLGEVKDGSRTSR